MSDSGATPTSASDTTKLTLAVILTTQLGYGGMGVMPFLMGALIDHRGLAPAAAGLLGSVELAGLAVASIGLAGLFSRGRRKGWILVSLGVAALGHGLSVLDFGYEVLIASRAIAGVGEGGLVAGGMAAAAGARNPARLFATVGLVQGLLFAIWMLVTPFLIGGFGANGVFAVLAIATLMIAPVTAWVPDAPRAAEPTSATETPSQMRIYAWLAITALVTLGVGQTAVFVFVERLGLRSGLSAEAIGIVLAVGALVGMAGSGAAVWAGARFGSVRPVVIGLATYVFFAVAMIHVAHPVVFTGSNLGFGFVYSFFYPYIMGALAALDRTGRWTATAVGVSTLGVALGPVLGGVLIGIGWGAVSLSIVISTPIGLFMLLPALRNADRGGDDAETDGTGGAPKEPFPLPDAQTTS